MDEGRDNTRSLMKGEKLSQIQILANTSIEVTVTILKSHVNAILKRSSPPNKAKREASRNEPVKKARCQAESKALEKLIISPT